MKKNKSVQPIFRNDNLSKLILYKSFMANSHNLFCTVSHNFIFVFFILLFSLSLKSAEKPLIIADFDTTLPVDKWKVSGSIDLAKVNPENVPEGVRGTALKISFPDNKSFIYSPSKLFKANLGKYDHVVFWLYIEPEASEGAVFEFQIMDKNNSSRFWRKVQVTHKGWKKISLPLRWFRWGGKLSPSWNDVSRIAIYPRKRCSFVIDSLQFTDEDNSLGLFVNNTTDLQTTLLGGKESSHFSNNFFIVSQTKKVDVKKLGRHFTTVLSEIETQVPSLKRQPGEAIPYLVILENGDGFKKALTRYGDMHLSHVPETDSSGFSMMNSAFSSYSEKYGTMRPVYLHEFIHAVLATQGRIIKSHNWIHEGFATYFQMKYQPQKGLDRIIIDSLSKENLSDHIKNVVLRSDIQFKDYVFVMMIAETLWESDKYKKNVSDFFEYMEKSGDVNFESILKNVYRKSFSEFIQDMQTYLSNKYK